MITPSRITFLRIAFNAGATVDDLSITDGKYHDVDYVAWMIACNGARFGYGMWKTYKKFFLFAIEGLNMTEREAEEYAYNAMEENGY